MPREKLVRTVGGGLRFTRMLYGPGEPRQLDLLGRDDFAVAAPRAVGTEPGEGLFEPTKPQRPRGINGTAGPTGQPQFGRLDEGGWPTRDCAGEVEC